MFHILAVDDEPVILDLIKDTLELKNYKVTGARNVSTAEKVFSSDKFDAILLDLAIPGKKNGLDFFNELIESKTKIPIIIMTGKLRSSDYPHFIDRGAAGFLSKPFTSSQLIDMVEMAFNY